MTDIQEILIKTKDEAIRKEIHKLVDKMLDEKQPIGTINHIQDLGNFQYEQTRVLIKIDVEKNRLF